MFIIPTIRRFAGHIAAAYTHRRAVQELRQLSPRLLADIGIDPGNIELAVELAAQSRSGAKADVVTSGPRPDPAVGAYVAS